MDIRLYASPIQGFSDYRFRNAFEKHFGGIDTYVAPYIRLKGKQGMLPKHQKDIHPDNNGVHQLVPQLMTNSADEFLMVAKFVQELGYQELNWNLGCPYPMVAKRSLGSGLIKDPNKIDEVLTEVLEKSEIKISMKMRLGYESNQEIFDVLSVLEKHDLQYIAIHPRIGKQLYKGTVDLDSFEKCIAASKHKVHYNGDISSAAIFTMMQERFPSIENWWVGRGIFSDPFLPLMIKSNATKRPDNWVHVFTTFHEELFANFSESLSGGNHIFMKMQPYWEYFGELFADHKKLVKRVKKAKGLKSFESAVKELLNAAK